MWSTHGLKRFQVRYPLMNIAFALAVATKSSTTADVGIVSLLHSLIDKATTQCRWACTAQHHTCTRQDLCPSPLWVSILWGSNSNVQNSTNESDKLKKECFLTPGSQMKLVQLASVRICEEREELEREREAVRQVLSCLHSPTGRGYRMLLNVIECYTISILNKSKYLWNLKKIVASLSVNLTIPWHTV